MRTYRLAVWGLLAIIMCAASSAARAGAQADEARDWIFQRDNGRVTITGYIGNDTDVVVPSTIDGDPVTSLVNVGTGILEYYDPNTGLTSAVGTYSAFRDCTRLTNVIIGYGVTSIAEEMFMDCKALTEISIPASVTSIGRRAFRDCIGLTDITIPDSVTDIGEGAFMGCTGLTGVTIPDSAMSIGNSAFQGCVGLTKVLIPDNVTSIGYLAFHGCTQLTSITLGSGVTSIGWLEGEALVEINVSENNSVYSSIDGVLFSKDGTVLFIYPHGRTQEIYTIPDSVTSVQDSAFRTLENLSVVYKGITYRTEIIGYIQWVDVVTGEVVNATYDRPVYDLPSDFYEAANGG